MPSSTSSVHGLARTLELDLTGDSHDPRDAPEQMMRRVDRGEVEAVCRHLLGDHLGGRAGLAAGRSARERIGAGTR